MTRNFVRTIARLSAGSALACVLALGAAAADKAPDSGGAKLSKAVGPTMNAAQKAANAGDWQGAITQARAAQAVADRTPFDDVEINDFIGVAAVNLKDYKTATAAFEAAADSPANSDMPAADREQLYHNALLLSADAQQWQKAIAYGQVLEGMNKMDDALYADMAVGYYNLKDTAHATQYAQKSIAAAKAAGKQPDQNVLKIVMSGEVASNPAAAEEQLGAIVMQSNSPEDWGRLIDHNFGDAGMNEAMAMDLYRLKLLTHSMKPDDASLAAKLANELYNYGDAQRILHSQNLGGKDLAAANSGAAKEQGSLAAAISAAKRGSGQDALRVAEGLYGYGRYAEAEELAREAMAKGTAKGKCGAHCDSAEAALLVGMSQAGQGKFAEAAATFNGITSGTQADVKTAHLWSMYAQIQQHGAAPAAAAPAQGAPAPG